MSLSGVVFLDKPIGWSSRRAVNEVARCLGGGRKTKAGHTGTLDPLASGMLPILLGSATRFAALGLEAEKLYRIQIDLSLQTTTLDAEGEVCGRFDGWQQLDHDTIANQVQSMVGEQDQTPPIYSAIRINGQRSHKLARSGNAVALPARSISIYSIDMMDISLPVVTLKVRCSKGTYMRALARDLGDALGVGGAIVGLRRLQTAGWDESLMVTMAQLQSAGEQCMHPVEFWLRHLPTVVLSRRDAARILHGQRVANPDFVLQEEAVMLCDNICLGTGKVKVGQGDWPVLHPIRVIPNAEIALHG